MAVTQQLARVDEDLLEQCRHDVHRLDDLCSYRLLEPHDHLDLDWSPAALELAAVVAGCSADRVAALTVATAGAVEVDPAYRDLPGSVVGHPVAYHPARSVQELHHTLRLLVQEGFPGADAARAAAADAAPTLAPEVAPGYLANHLHALVDFYAGAALRALCVVTWWD